jgi:hypothetical protein
METGMKKNPPIPKLPDNVDWRSANLPDRYRAAKAALAECDDLDECLHWSDKAAALASYARQIHDRMLEHLAIRIRARAIRRCGDLLRQFDARGDHMKTDGAVLSRTHVAEAAGLSERQRKTAIQLANIPADRFEQLIDKNKEPPTITQLSKIGTAIRSTNVEPPISINDKGSAPAVVATLNGEELHKALVRQKLDSLRFAVDVMFNAEDYAVATQLLFTKSDAEVVRWFRWLENLSSLSTWIEEEWRVRKRGSPIQLFERR